MKDERCKLMMMHVYSVDALSNKYVRYGSAQQFASVEVQPRTRIRTNGTGTVQ